MSARVISNTTEEIPAPESVEPQPWLSAEDRRGWKTVSKGKRFGAPLDGIKFDLDLVADQTEWLLQEVRRTGIGPKAIIGSLIDEARAAR